MSTPLSAVNRIEFQFIVDGQPHRFRHYCRVAASLDPSGYSVNARPPGTPIGVSVAVDRVWTLLAPIYPAANSSFGSAVIQQFSGGAWLPIAAWNTAVTPSAGFAYVKAGQLTMTMRDSAFHKVRAIWLEQGAPIPFKTTSPTGGGAQLNAIAAGYTSPSAIAFDPGLWVRGRSDLYISSFVSFVTDLNDRVRRTRGIA